MAHHETQIDLSGYGKQDIAFIREEAMKRDCSFDEAAKQIMLERIRQMRQQPQQPVLAKLFRFLTVH